MSLFYAAHYEHLFPIPMLAFERINALQDQPPEQVLPKVLAECCGKTKPTDEEIEYFLRRIREESEAAQEKVGSRPATPTESQQEKSLGTSFQKFMADMDSSRLLLWACGYDYVRADYLYSRVDRSIAMQIVNDFIQVQHERNTYLFEAALYGFGGSYRGDEPSGDEGDIDLTDMDASSIMQMLR